jgi:hypothetical protein
MRVRWDRVSRHGSSERVERQPIVFGFIASLKLWQQTSRPMLASPLTN